MTFTSSNHFQPAAIARGAAWLAALALAGCASPPPSSSSSSQPVVSTAGVAQAQPAAAAPIQLGGTPSSSSSGAARPPGGGGSAPTLGSSVAGQSRTFSTQLATYTSVGFDAVPGWVRDEVSARARAARAIEHPEDAFRGLALDPVAFAVDIERWGFFDAHRQGDR